MPISDVLKGLRSSSYGESESDHEESPSERVLELSEDEMKSLGEPSEGDIVVQVTGKVRNGCLYVSSVKGSGHDRDVNADSEELISKFRDIPMVKNQTQPSPS